MVRSPHPMPLLLLLSLMGCARQTPAWYPLAERGCASASYTMAADVSLDQQLDQARLFVSDSAREALASQLQVQVEAATAVETTASSNGSSKTLMTEDVTAETVAHPSLMQTPEVVRVGRTLYARVCLKGYPEP